MIGKVEADQCDFCKRYFAYLHFCIAGGEFCFDGIDGEEEIEKWFLCNHCYHRYKDVANLTAIAPETYGVVRLRLVDGSAYYQLSGKRAGSLRKRTYLGIP
jgi:hypothetical protein